MTYASAVDYLFQRLPMYSRVGTPAYKADLTNTIALCEILDNPELRFPTVHVAGTNGKGSTSHMLAAIFQAAGYRTGLYTSPHLQDFRERIRVDGNKIEEAFVSGFVEYMQPHIEKVDPSFFELTVALAFDYFANREVDIAIIETGLGGRLDSTNVITPELSVITNIGFDHMHLLGDTLEKIAVEKAGIIKKGVPVVVGEFQPASGPVFVRKARELKSSITFADRERNVSNWSFGPQELTVEVTLSQTDQKENYTLDLPGLYQARNLLTVLESVHQLRQKGWKLPPDTVRQALRHVRTTTGLHGRWERLHDHPTLITDVAHNADGVAQLVRQLEVTTFHHLHVVLGMVRDKDAGSLLGLLPPSATYYFTQAAIPRALPAETLREQALDFHLEGEAYPDVNAALKQALAAADKDDLILVCGSVFLVGEVDRTKYLN